MNSNTITIKEIKAESRVTLINDLNTPVRVNLGYTLLSLIMNNILTEMFGGSDILSIVLGEAFYFLTLLLLGVFEYGQYSVYLNAQFGKKTSFLDLFSGFRNQPDRILKIQIVLTVIDVICLLPMTFFSYLAPEDINIMVYVGIVLVLNLLGSFLAALIKLPFFPIWFLLQDYANLSAGKALKTSIKVMKGKKMKAFLLYLSYLPMYLLGVLSMGIGNLWITAYLLTSCAVFYRKVILGRA